MYRRIAIVATFLTMGIVVAYPQDGSTETFHAIRLEHSSSPGARITLSAPTGLTSYNLEYPATPAPTDRRYSLSLNQSSGSMSWYATPWGSAGQIPFFESDEELIGSPNLLWDNFNQTMTISSTKNKPMLKMTKTVALKDSVEDAIFQIDANYSSLGSEADNVEIKLIDFSLDGTGLANGATAYGIKIDINNLPGNPSKPSSATGLYVNVENVDSARAIIVPNGNTGIGTEQPDVMMDIDGDVAFREYNFTGVLADTVDLLDFDGSNNRHSFVRIASPITQQTFIKGLVGGYSGKILKIYNATEYTIVFRHEASSDSTANISTSASADVALLPGNAYELLYSSEEKNWIVAYSGPGELSQLGNKTVGPVSDGEVLPSSVTSYLQVVTPETGPPNTYDVALENGTTPGQILVIQNNGPLKIAFETTNAIWDNTSDLQDGESIILIWSGENWVQVARASN